MTLPVEMKTGSGCVRFPHSRHIGGLVLNDAEDLVEGILYQSYLMQGSMTLKRREAQYDYQHSVKAGRLSRIDWPPIATVSQNRFQYKTETVIKSAYLNLVAESQYLAELTFVSSGPPPASLNDKSQTLTCEWSVYSRHFCLLLHCREVQLDVVHAQLWKCPLSASSWCKELSRWSKISRDWLYSIWVIRPSSLHCTHSLRKLKLECNFWCSYSLM